MGTPGGNVSTVFGLRVAGAPPTMVIQAPQAAAIRTLSHHSLQRPKKQTPTGPHSSAIATVRRTRILLPARERFKLIQLDLYAGIVQEAQPVREHRIKRLYDLGRSVPGANDNRHPVFPIPRVDLVVRQR